jgi:hypothetical protein
MKNISKVRRLRAEASSSRRHEKKQSDINTAQIAEKVRQEAAEKLQKELAEKKAIKKAEMMALKAQEAETKRQQQYMGIASTLAAKTREDQLQKGLERTIRTIEIQEINDIMGYESAKISDTTNRVTAQRKEMKKHRIEQLQKDEEYAKERVNTTRTIKEDFLYKKNLVKEGQNNHARVKQSVIDHNPYAANMSSEIHTNTMKLRTRSGGSIKFPSIASV